MIYVKNLVLGLKHSKCSLAINADKVGFLSSPYLILLPHHHTYPHALPNNHSLPAREITDAREGKRITIINIVLIV